MPDLFMDRDLSRARCTIATVNDTGATHVVSILATGRAHRAVLRRGDLRIYDAQGLELARVEDIAPEDASAHFHIRHRPNA
jgi:hypothetical protein